MKNLQQKLESFANSSYSSNEEEKFVDDTIAKYYDEKLRQEYARVLEVEHGITRLNSESSNSVKSKRYSMLGKVLISLLVLAFLLAAAFFLNKMNEKSSTNYQVADNLDPYYTEIDFNTRGAVTDAAKLVDLVAFYDSKDFNSVSGIYKSLESLDIGGNYLHAIAVSLAKNDELDEAIKVWNSLLETEESKFTYHNVARWFMGRAMKVPLSQVKPLLLLSILQSAEL